MNVGFPSACTTWIGWTEAYGQVGIVGQQTAEAGDVSGCRQTGLSGEQTRTWSREGRPHGGGERGSAFFVLGLGCARHLYTQAGSRSLDLLPIFECTFIELASNHVGMLLTHVVRGRQNPLHVGFAHRLARCRKAAKLSRSALSDAVAMARNTASQLERKERIPRLDTVEKLAKALTVSPCMLAYGVEMSCEADVAPLADGLPECLFRLRQARGLSGASGSSSPSLRYTTSASPGHVGRYPCVASSDSSSKSSARIDAGYQTPPSL